MASINKIFDAISSAINASRTPPAEIPTALLFTSARMRPGLSPITTASKIITRQGEAGAPVGALPSGEPNINEMMEIIRVEEIFKALLEDARIDIAVEPGIPLEAQGANSAGPVIAIGLTTGIGKGNGIIR